MRVTHHNNMSPIRRQKDLSVYLALISCSNLYSPVHADADAGGRRQYSAAIQEPPLPPSSPSTTHPEDSKMDSIFLLVGLATGSRRDQAVKSIRKCLQTRQTRSHYFCVKRMARPPPWRPRDWRRPCRRRRRRVCIPMQLHCAMGAYVY